MSICIPRMRLAINGRLEFRALTMAIPFQESDSQPSGLAGTPEMAAVISEISRHLEILKAMMHTSESGFLSVGSHLQRIHLSTQEISTKLSELMKKYSEETGTQSLNQLRVLSERAANQLSSFNAFSMKAVSNLKELEEPLASLPDSLRDFDRVVLRLRKMGIIAHIEAARIGDEGLDFVRLAEAVTALGEQITSKAKDVRSYVNGVNDVIGLNKRKMESMIGRHGEVTSHVTSHMASNLSVLTEKRESIQRVAVAIAEKSDEAVRNVNNIVQSVQYHDITRQQVDHVIQSLEAIGSEDTVLEIVPICEIQVAQLKRVGMEFERAIYSIEAALKELSAAVSEMFTESVNITSSTKVSGRSFIDEVESGLEIVSATMTEDQFAVDELASSLRQISENIRKMRSFMDEMAEVGSEIELLALNSRVKAARTGGGATLGVIAESIENLSVATLRLVDEVLLRMSDMVTASKELVDDHAIESVTNHADTEIRSIIDQLRRIVVAFHENNAISNRVFVETQEMCSAIVGQLQMLTSEIVRNQEIALTLVETASALEQVASELRRSVPDSSRLIIDERLEEMRKNYTMETERSTYSSVMNGSADQRESLVESTGSIELF